ncbi:hypothetical protein PP175_13070 [Aneurinibacillus sp. Ricciae_BoGa-3]|uniref:hypothetical protein n=1 Tax=Aneurinibacillus sp. Ricciae_BoGa-3 TaxID=3022697 RepID=UPI0023413B79|nr:hypothetical protein [Aneurinibacillus sp. Ricciae_BoGa-3]WCK52389.1 hypothetical protein PP175_13070 [Aneurinibacillus sp. Ricciae_BoGa-3]
MNKRIALISGSLLVLTVSFSSVPFVTVMPITAAGPAGAQEAGLQAAGTPALEVEHSIEGKSVQLYFSTNNFQIASPGARAGKRAGEGHILLWVDGKITKQYKKEVQLPALTSGNHKFAVELAGNDDTPYPNTRIEFDVTLP